MPERASQRTGQERDADHTALFDRGEQGHGVRALQRPPLELEIRHEKWSQ